MPFLQLHQLRVAAVAKQICESLDMTIDTDSVVTAALLHDMGNILKFDFTRFPEVFQPEGTEYWKDVQREYREKYGDDEHEATLAIARELKVADAAFSYIDAVGFRNVITNVADPCYEKKVCCYADQRVGPFGVLSIAQRLEEGAKRYANHSIARKRASHFNRSSDGLLELERQIFAKSAIVPEAITDTLVTHAVEKLRQWRLPATHKLQR